MRAVDDIACTPCYDERCVFSAFACAAAHMMLAQRSEWTVDACRKAKAAQAPNASLMPTDLDNTQIEDLIAEFAGELEILPSTPRSRSLP